MIVFQPMSLGAKDRPDKPMPDILIKRHKDILQNRQL